MTKESETLPPSRPPSPTTHQIPCSGTTADRQWLRALYDSLGCQDLSVTDPEWCRELVQELLVPYPYDRGLHNRLELGAHYQHRWED